MKNENEIKRAFAKEVIEEFNHSDQTFYNTFEIVKIVQSLLPKEDIELHPTTPEMQEQFLKANPDMRTETKTFEVPIIERSVGNFVSEYLESNFGYDLSNETEDQRKYRIETIYSTLKALKQDKTESDEVKFGEVNQNELDQLIKDAQDTISRAIELRNKAVKERQERLEQKARKKAEEIVKGARKENPISPIPDIVYGIVQQALLIDPKTL